MTGRTALITAARGIGDIVRITPLVRACVMLGYEVDVLIAPDYADTASLLRGAPDIGALYQMPSAWNGSGITDIAGLQTSRYDVAVYTVWTATYRSMVRPSREIVFDRATWLAHGDSAGVDAAARTLGWAGPLPRPFVMTSDRRFGMPPGTVADRKSTRLNSS